MTDGMGEANGLPNEGNVISKAKPLLGTLEMANIATPLDPFLRLAVFC